MTVFHHFFANFLAYRSKFKNRFDDAISITMIYQPLLHMGQSMNPWGLIVILVLPPLLYLFLTSNQINEKPQVVNEYEQGKAIPNQQIIGKMERILGVKLRGKGTK